MLRDLALQALVVAMMTAVGLDLSLAEARAGLSKRWLLALALVVNLLVMPALVVGLSWALVLPSGLATGLLVCAVAPGGPTGPLFTRLARADLGFATALQVLLSSIVLISAPISLELLGGHGDRSVMLPMAQTLALFQLLPLAAGLALRWRWPELAGRLAKPIGMLANGLLVAVVLGLLVTRGHLLASQGLGVHFGLIGLVLLPISLGLVWPAKSSALRATLIAAGLVTTVRNLTIALLLASSFYADDPSVDIAILVWGFYMMLLPGLLSWRLGRAKLRAAEVALG